MKKHTYNFQPHSQINPVEQLINSAVQLHQQGNLQLAEQNYRKALEMQPKNAFVLNLLGVLKSQKGEHQEGEKLISKAIKIDPEVADYHSNLGLCLQQLGKPEAAEKAFKKALQIDTKFVPALFGLGNINLQFKKPEHAIELFRKVITIDTNYLPAYNNLGNLYRELKEYDEALKLFNRVLEIKPDFADAWYNIGLVYLAQHQGEQAVNAFRKATELKTKYFRAHFKLGDCYGFLLQDLQAAVGEYDCAIMINPRFIPAYIHKSSVYRLNGKFDLSDKVLREALEVDPSAIDAYLELVKVNTKEADLDKMQSVLNNMELDLKQLINLHITMGKIYDDKKDYTKAFQHFQQGNTYKQEIEKYDAEGYHQYIDKQIQTFTAPFIESYSGLGLDTELPVFIVGMPRSGTTLTEQILASHPAVHGTGETEYMVQVTEKFWQLLRKKCKQTTSAEMPHLEKHELEQVVSEYMDYFRKFEPLALRVTEKMPGNYEQLGLIAILFPKARIIHCRRNPLDTCLSIYFQNFSLRHSYANNLTDLGVHYRMYLRLMEYWQEVLGDRILTVNYEDMVQDLEKTGRRLIDFVGLPWDDSCLQFHTTERVVKTASQWQVRQKLYSHSVERWRNYEPWLGPLVEALGDSVNDVVYTDKNNDNSGT